MTLFGIDISHHQTGIDLQRVKNEGFTYVLARVGQGKGGKYGTVKDSQWIRHRDEARRVGLKLCAYWYIGNGISPAQNAELCEDWIGDKSIPVALDCEAGSGNADFFRVTLQEFRNHGMRVPLSYIPKWYWQSIGSPSLDNLPPLWSSRYVNGGGTAVGLYPGDSSPLWNGYGGNNVGLLQYTSSAQVAGYVVDADAFKGTLEQLDYLFYGTFNPKPEPPKPPVEDPDMQLTDVVGVDSNGKTYTVQDVMQKQWTTPVVPVQYMLDQINDILVLVSNLPEEYRQELIDRCNNIRTLIHTKADQITWEGLRSAAVTWDDLSAKQWGKIQ